jgi:hypothetical protein
LLNVAVPPQDVLLTESAVLDRTLSVASTLPRRAGTSDQISATVAATCGVAIEVPDSTA